MGLVHHNITPCIKSWRLASWRRDSIFRASSRVAQLVEQPAVNRRVAGSSPASGASQLSAPQSLSDAQFSPSGAGDGFGLPFGGRDDPRPVEHHTAAGSRRLAAEPRSRSASRKGGSPKSLLYSRLKCDASS